MEDQVEIGSSIATSKRVAWKAGQKVGKSYLDVAMGCWWAETRLNAVTILTCATEDQVKIILWRSLRTIVADRQKEPGFGDSPIWVDAPDWVRGACASNPFPELPRDPRIGFESPLTGNPVFGRVSGTAVGTQGFSGSNLLIIADEASGIPEDIFAAMEGNTAGGGCLFMSGNPNHVSGKFFDVFSGVGPIQSGESKKNGIWTLFSTRSWDTINARTGEDLVPGLAIRSWCEEMLEQWGERDPRYQVRVLGEFPTQAADAVISFGLLDEAQRRVGVEEPPGLSVGVDVARFGDDSSVVQGIRGKCGYEPREMSGYDTIEVADMTLEYIDSLLNPGERCIIKVDTGGGYGGGVVDQLRERLKEHHDSKMLHVYVVEVNPSEEPDEPDYDNRRAELWFGVRKWLSEGGYLPSHDLLEKELLATKYSFTPKGKIRIEPKEEIKKRIRRSPDFADALALAVFRNSAASPAAPIVSGQSRLGRGRGY